MLRFGESRMGPAGRVTRPGMPGIRARPAGIRDAVSREDLMNPLRDGRSSGARVKFSPRLSQRSSRSDDEIMNGEAEDQRHRVRDQFTRQAAPFAVAHAADAGNVGQLLAEAVRVSPGDDVLDVACGPGL